MPAVPDPVGWQKIMEGTTENNLKSPDAYGKYEVDFTHVLG